MAKIANQDGPHPVDVHIGQRIAARRVSLGLSQTNLAQALGITFQQVQKYEKGANRISGSRMWEAAKTLGVTVDYFYTGLDNSTPEGVVENRLATTPTGRRALAALGVLEPSELAAVTVMLEAFTVARRTQAAAA